MASSIVSPDYQNAGNYKERGRAFSVGKYEGSEGQPLMNDLKVLRVAEMYFIHAEAQAAQGDLAGAAATTFKALQRCPF